MFDTGYVRSNALDFSAGRGALFIQRVGAVIKYDEASSQSWLPDAPLSLREVYRAGRRWAYTKLERHYAEQTTARDPLVGVFAKLHKHLLSSYERHMGYK
jgi:hypothetical protein